MKNTFTEEDEKRYIEALNYIAKMAKFVEVDTVKGSIELYKHFSFLQSVASKINSNILEIRKLHSPNNNTEDS